MRYIQEAQYTPSILPAYRGNPLIEALPDYLDYSSKDMRRCLRTEPAALHPQANRRQKGAWLMTLNRDLFIEQPFHLHLQEAIDLAIREGYYQRKPMTPAHAAYLRTIYERQKQGDQSVTPNYGASSPDPLSVSVIGCSGVGKTTAISRILSLYPQVLHHRADRIGSETLQVTYLRVECPHDGSIKTLCCSIIKALDEATGQDYSSVYVNRRTTLDMLKERMSHLMAVHYVGLLVIDEIQNILASRKNKEALFNFIVSLVNTLGVPILYVGTPKIAAFMERDLRVARRFGSMGSFRWDRFEKNSQEWKALVERLWDCSVLENDDGPIPEEINNALYDCSQGIVDVLVKLFILTQMQQLVYGRTELTKEALYAEFNANFQRVAPMIDALRRNDLEAIARYEDIAIPESEFNELAEKKYEAIEAKTTEVAEQQESGIDFAGIAELCRRMNIRLTKSLLRKLQDPTQNPIKALLDAHSEEHKKPVAASLTTNEQADIGSLE